MFNRTLWALVTVAALIGFLYFMISKLVLLLQYPKAVNVEVVFVQEITFPAVTICNENYFR